MSKGGVDTRTHYILNEKGLCGGGSYVGKLLVALRFLPVYSSEP